MLIQPIFKTIIIRYSDHFTGQCIPVINNSKRKVMPSYTSVTWLLVELKQWPRVTPDVLNITLAHVLASYSPCATLYISIMSPVSHLPLKLYIHWVTRQARPHQKQCDLESLWHVVHRMSSLFLRISSLWLNWLIDCEHKVYSSHLFHRSMTLSEKKCCLKEVVHVFFTSFQEWPLVQEFSWHFKKALVFMDDIPWVVLNTSSGSALALCPPGTSN